MDFTMTTIGFCSSSLPPSSFIGKRKRLAPPSKDVLPKSPSIFSSGDIGDGKDTAYHVSLLSLLQGRIFSTPSNTMKSPRRKSLDGPFPTEDDDDTASTVSVSTSSDSLDEEDDCDFSNRKSVSFSYPLVTKIHTRPTTTFEDKYYLHYSDLDYLDFKIGFVTGRDRTRKVTFARDVVSQVAAIPSISNDTRKTLYYSEPELQRFLDEFVQSLHHHI